MRQQEGNTNQLRNWPGESAPAIASSSPLSKACYDIFVKHGQDCNPITRMA